ncbi:MAG: ligase-associated DNA damage response endonuclease PdeM [Fimbriimonadaceae bacterium]|nr:ligase-associated DNA damage response endonuclease PdeM [Fimbriimonadaceae bacterium]
MEGGLEIRVGGAAVRLRPDRTVLVGRTLFAADLHLGKDRHARRLGVPVPLGSDEETLGRLDAAWQDSGAEALCILGDLWHSAVGMADGAESRLADWALSHRHRPILLVRGNHDRGAAGLEERLGWTGVEEGGMVEGFQVRHHPPADRRSGAWLAGHIHPAVRVGGRRESVQCPCFWRTGEGLVLPAFGALTGAGRADFEPEDEVFAVAGGLVSRVPL